MERLLQVAKLLLIVLLGAAIGEVAYTIHRLRPKLEVTITNIDRTVIIVGAASGDVEKGARAWKAASDAQAQQSTAVLESSHRALIAFQNFVVHTDATINTSLLPSIQTQLETQSRSLSETQEQLRKELLAMADATQQLQKTLGDADKVIADPQIPVTLQHLADTSAQTEQSMENLRGATLDVKLVADKFRDDFVKPKNRAWAYLKAVLGLGSEARILFNK